MDESRATLIEQPEKVLLTAGYCGLACKACSVYIASSIGGQALAQRAEKAGMTPDEMYCEGCRSEKTSPYCTKCEIKRCIREKGLTWCSECDAYPCEGLNEFQGSLPHRVEILASLDFAKEHSVIAWDEAMHKDFSCQQCGTYNSVYADGCPGCGNKIANPFAKRHWDMIQDSLERALVNNAALSTKAVAKDKDPIEEYIEALSAAIPSHDSLKQVKQETVQFLKCHSVEEAFQAIEPLYDSDNFQIQEVGVLLCGYIGTECPAAISFLRRTVSHHESWKVQEVLAMAFDIHCNNNGYERSLSIIEEWLNDENANVRRAASEGLRVWTSRPYFASHPEAAITLLASRREDESEYVRKSVGNALRDISKRFPELIKSEVSSWDLTLRPIMQVYKHIYRGSITERKA